MVGGHVEYELLYVKWSYELPYCNSYDVQTMSYRLRVTLCYMVMQSINYLMLSGQMSYHMVRGHVDYELPEYVNGYVEYE